MKKYKHTIIIGIVLIVLSVILHYVHYLIFHDFHHLMIYLLGDIAFIPLEVFFVSVVLERLIEIRDEKHIARKINMLIGLFYQELGNDMLVHFVKADPKIETDQMETAINHNWDEANYDQLSKKILAHHHSVNPAKINFEMLDEKLSKHKALIVNLISNPTTLEHGQFSEVLMTTFHVADELKHRDIHALKKEDVDHLKVDIDRAYKQLAKEWVVYMSHMQNDYPYLFSTAIKNNPFDPKNCHDQNC